VCVSMHFPSLLSRAQRRRRRATGQRTDRSARL